MRRLTLAGALLIASSLAHAQEVVEDVVEPRSRVSFSAKEGTMSFVGAGLRVKGFAFIKAKVYAIGLYIDDAALAQLKGKGAAAAKDVVAGDFPKQVVLKFVRDLNKSTIQEAMLEALAGADRNHTQTFVSYFDTIKTGDVCALRWAPGGSLEVVIGGTAKPPIADKEFATDVFAIWLGDKPLQDDIKRDLLKGLM